MEGIKIEGYQMNYGGLTIEATEKNEYAVKAALYFARISELKRAGVKATRICKPTKKGTKVTYKSINDKKKMLEELEYLERELIETIKEAKEKGKEIV